MSNLLLLGVGAARPGAGAFPLDALTVTAAWSLSRDLLASFAGGTRYTKSGSDIITLEDQSGNNRDLTDVLVAGRRPAETTAGPNSKLCADFDGSTDYLETTAQLSSFVANNSGAIVISAIVDAVTLNNANIYQNHQILGDSAQFAGIFCKNTGGTTPQAASFNWDGNADVTALQNITTGTAYVFMWRHNGGTLYFSMNGGAEISAASGNTSTLTGVLRMAIAGGGTNCNCKVFEAFTTNDGSQTVALAAAIADMKTWIGA